MKKKVIMYHLRKLTSLLEVFQWWDCCYPTLMLANYINYSRILESYFGVDSERERLSRETMLPTVSGIEPYSWFDEISRITSLLPKDFGISPSSSLWERKSSSRETMLPNVSGIEPLSWLKEISTLNKASTECLGKSFKLIDKEFKICKRSQVSNCVQNPFLKLIGRESNICKKSHVLKFVWNLTMKPMSRDIKIFKGSHVPKCEQNLTFKCTISEVQICKRNHVPKTIQNRTI